MKVYEYLLNELNFNWVSVKEIGMSDDVIEAMYIAGYSKDSKFLKGVINNKEFTLIPVSNLYETAGIIAGANLTTLAHVSVDSRVLDKEISNDIKEILAHEVEHLKRGVVKVSPDEIKTLNDLGEIYLKEEQEINKKVAPGLYVDYQQLVSNITVKEWIDDPNGRQLVVGGLLAVYNQSKEIKEVVDRLIKGTDLEKMVESIWS